MYTWPSPTSLPDVQNSPYGLQSTDDNSAVLRTDVAPKLPGFPQQRARSCGSYKVVPVQFTMSQAQYLFFQNWFEAQISGGADFFIIPLDVGAGFVNYVARFMNGAYSTKFNNPFWVVTATLEYEDTAT
jgi:hypothetical protein